VGRRIFDLGCDDRPDQFVVSVLREQRVAEGEAVRTQQIRERPFENGF
jgi:hypothetical protein